MSTIRLLLNAILDIAAEMSPYLLLGFLIAGILHAFIPRGWYARYLSGRNFRSVVNAALFGIPLPLCSCGVLPTAMSLRKEGASKGAVTSFLIATPQTGVDSILATSALLGLPFAIIRPIVALATALLGGALVNADSKDTDDAPSQHEHEAPEQHHCCCHDEEHEAHEHPHCCCHGDEHEAHEHHHCCCHDEEPQRPLTFGQRIIEALRFGFIEMMEDIGRWLVVGLIIAGLITTLVPDEWFAAFRGNTPLSMLLVLCISIPMYVCATGSIPIAVALMLKGLTPGSALVLLMAGPAVNAASILVIRQVMGQRTLVRYLVAIIAGALLFGAGIDYLLPREWFTQALTASVCHHHDEVNAFTWLCTAVLCLLLLNVMRLRLQHKDACSCGHCHE